MLFNLGKAETGRPVSLPVFEFCVGIVKKDIHLKDK